MNLKVMYCPFPADAVLIGAGERIVASHNSKHRMDQFRDEVVVPGDKALKDVYRFQQLYIVAHGASGADSIYDDAGGSLTVTDLAQQLLDQKLTTAISKVKLYCCQGGAGGITSTAKQLKDAMVGKGFNNVTVFGYTLYLAQGDLTDKGGKLAVDADFAPDGSYTTSNPTRAKAARTKF